MPLGDGIIEGLCDKTNNCTTDWGNYTFPRDGGGLGSCRTNSNIKNPGARGFREFLRDRLVAAGVNMTYVGSVQVVEGLAHEGHYAFTIPDLDYCIQNAEWLEKAKPDMILLSAGVLEILFEDPPEVVLENLRGLLTRIYQELPETTEVIVAQTPTGREDLHILSEPYEPLFAPRWAEFNAAIPGLVGEFRADGKHVSYVDMMNTVQSPDEYDEFGLAPNPVAAERMAQIWFEKIMEILTQQP